MPLYLHSPENKMFNAFFEVKSNGSPEEGSGSGDGK